MFTSLSLSFSLCLSVSFGLFVCLLHYDEHSDQFLIFSLVAAASTAPDTTPKVTQLQQLQSRHCHISVAFKVELLALVARNRKI